MTTTVMTPLRLFAAAMIVTFSASAALAGGHGKHDSAMGKDMTKDTMTKDAMMHQDIVDTAIGAGSFNTLVAAVQAAGLVDTLKGDGPFTVFAPTDAAFAALPAGTVENLLKPENKDQLVAVLTYHVLPGKVLSGDIAGSQLQAETVQGSTVDINAQGGVKVDDASVVKADIVATNGVIHVIDQVILPN